VFGAYEGLITNHRDQIFRMVAIIGLNQGKLNNHATTGLGFSV